MKTVVLRFSCLFGLCLLGVAAFPSTVVAQEVSGITVRFDASCGSTLREDFLSAASLEFRSLTGAAVHELSADALWVRCAPGETEFRIALEPALNRTVSETQLVLGNAGRVLALAASELITAWDEQRRLRREPEPEELVSTDHAPTEAHERWLVSVGAMAMHAFEPGLLRLGGNIQLLHFLGERLALMSDLYFGWGSGAVEGGRLSATLVSLALRGYVTLVAEPVQILVGAGYRASASYWAGQPSLSGLVGRGGWATWSGPLIGAAAMVPISDLRLQLFTEGGYAISSSGLVDERVVFEVDGPWLAMGVGVGIAL